MVELPIACVEVWSATAAWAGVRVRDLLDEAGVDLSAAVRVVSLERHGRYRTSVLGPHHRDPLTLLALRVNGDVLDLDHGYPCRLLAPNHPGVLQTKWVTHIEGAAVKTVLYLTWAALIGYGAYGLLGTEPLDWARFAATVLIAHDAVLVLLVIATGALVTRAVPGNSRAYVQSGLVIGGAVTLLAVPFVLGFGRSADLPSALPLDYGTGLAVTLAAVWTGVAAVAALRWFRRRGSRR